MVMRPLPDKPRQSAVRILYVTAGTQTFVVAAVGNSAAVVMTPEEAEKASVDFWSAAAHARRDTAINEQIEAMNKRVIRTRKTRKGALPLTD